MVIKPNGDKIDTPATTLATTKWLTMPAEGGGQL